MLLNGVFSTMKLNIGSDSYFDVYYVNIVCNNINAITYNLNRIVVIRYC